MPIIGYYKYKLKENICLNNIIKTRNLDLKDIVSDEYCSKSIKICYQII